MITASKKVTGKFLYPGRNAQRRLTLLEAGIILTKLLETPASPDQNNSSISSNDKVKKGVRELHTMSRAR